MTSPDTLLLLSGGIDSAYCMWWALSQGRALHVHHVHLKNHEGRLQYEARAVEGILNWMREQVLTNFRYTESSFDYGSIRWIVKDHCVWAFFIGIILADPQNKDKKTIYFTGPELRNDVPGNGLPQHVRSAVMTVRQSL